jgi:small subunit ribosomal protein S8
MVQRDWVSAMLNDIMNCKKAGKSQTTLMPVSNLMLEVLRLMHEGGYISEFKIEEDKFKRVVITLGKLNNCGAIRPRFFVKVNEFNRYIKRFLPGRQIGILILSTSQGLMSHKDAIQKDIGGSLIAYCY